MQDHLPVRDPPQLGDPLLDVAPVVDSQDGQGGIEARCRKRQRLGPRLNRRRGAGCTLVEHAPHQIDGHHLPVGRLVRPCTGADVQDGARLTERPVDLALDVRVGAAVFGIADPDPLVVGHRFVRPVGMRARSCSAISSTLWSPAATAMTSS